MRPKADICLNPSFTLRLGSVPSWCSAVMEGRAAAGSLWNVVFPAATVTLGLVLPPWDWNFKKLDGTATSQGCFSETLVNYDITCKFINRI